jgi:hypothetical protein
VGLSLPPGNVLLFPTDPALLDKNVLADLAVAVTPTHTLIMGQFRSARLSRAPLSRALLFHITPFPVSTRIVNSLEIAHHVLLDISVAIILGHERLTCFRVRLWLPKMLTATARVSSRTETQISLCRRIREVETSRPLAQLTVLNIYWTTRIARGTDSWYLASCTKNGDDDLSFFIRPHRL